MDKQNTQPAQVDENNEKKLSEKDNSQAEAFPKKAESPHPAAPEEKGKDETIGIP